MDNRLREGRAVRRRLIVGNWKMHKTASEAAVFVRKFTEMWSPRSASLANAVEIVLAPPFTALAAVAKAIPTSHQLGLGAQNVFWEDKGAFTGEISAPMLADLGCRYVIIGHSERRQHFGETDDGVNRKIKAALRHGLRPILCVGESLAEREGGQTAAVVTRQVQLALKDVTAEQGRDLVVAYEPVWAIGTGRAATAEQAMEVHRRLRNLLLSQWKAVATDIRILYGGSVTPDNTGAFLAAEEIDGALVGGACLDPGSFAKIVTLAQSVSR
jgi:triosephosphate isomerase